MSRTEYRVKYQIVSPDREPVGRVWCHIAHTRAQVLNFNKYLSSEAKRRAGKRGFHIIGVDARPVGRWEPLPGTAAEILKSLRSTNPSLEGGIKT